jgi:hypothetical protein
LRYRKAVNGPGRLLLLAPLLLVLGCGQAEPPRQAAVSATSATPVPAGQGKRAQASRPPRPPQPPEIPGIGRVVVDWQRSRTPPIRVVLGIGGLADGPQGGPLVPYLYPDPGLAEAAHYLSRTYAAFRAHLANGEMVFYGRGRVRPSLVEQRMVVEWARRSAAALAGGDDDAYGLALSWHRGASVGNCESVSVLLTGEVRAEACAWSEPVSGRLQPAALERVYDWFDTLGAFQESDMGAPGEMEPARLVFAGQGARGPTKQETAAIESFAAALLRELAARRRGGAPVPAPTPAATPEAQALPRLLLPQGGGSPALPPLARLAPAKPPLPPASPIPPAGSVGGGAGTGGGTSGRRSALSQPLR